MGVQWVIAKRKGMRTAQHSSISSISSSSTINTTTTTTTRDVITDK
jgi:hypothetical protein